ncbi:MAG TPA: argininosuccinate lyase [Trueperaceae bacterium]|nr:argininosuccinate lyase [Trueperaceae bacterium]
MSAGDDTPSPAPSANMWGGRFSEGMDDLVKRVNASIGVDAAMAREDLEGSLAHALMLTEQGILSKSDGAAIESGLRQLLSDLDEGRLEFDEGFEDVHMNLEHLLTERIGEVGGKLHTARSRNDQVATDMRLFLRRRGAELAAALARLREVLVDLAEKHVDVIMPGYTHLQVAQPVRLAHHLLAYERMFARDGGRLEDALDRADLSPLGAGALAGTTFPIDRERSAALLGFAGVAGNSLDAVSDRDFVIETLSALAITMMHLSRLSEELILWSSQEFGFVTLPDAYTTGSSMMPQKKNPDMCELVRGKTGRVYGALMGMLTVMKGLPLSYNKDMQEDKQGLFDALDTVSDCLAIYIGMLPRATFHAERMRAAAGAGFSNATDLADYLVRVKDLPFRRAHHVVGKLVALALDAGVGLEQLDLEQLRAVEPRITDDVYRALDLETVVDARDSLGGTSRARVLAALASAREELAGLGKEQGVKGAGSGA